MITQYRVVWKREGLVTRKIKTCGNSLGKAEWYFKMLQGTLDDNKPPEKLPPLEYVQIETRVVSTWSGSDEDEHNWSSKVDARLVEDLDDLDDLPY